MMRTSWQPIAIAALLVLAVLLAVRSLLGDSITFDETTHLASGVSYLETGDMRLAPDHPPLAKVWASLTLLVMDHRWPGPDAPGWREGNVFVFGKHWLFDLNDGQRLLVPARLMMVALLVVLLLCIHGIARRLFDPRAALLALALAALSPTLLAHGRLVTLDVPAALMTILTLIAFSRLTERLGAVRLAWAALALGALSVTKHHWPLVVPALAVMAIAAVIRKRPIRYMPPRAGHGPREVLIEHRLARLGALAGAGLVMGVVVWGSIWTAYGWRYSPFLGSDRDEARFIATSDPGEQPPVSREGAWETVLHDARGGERRGPADDLIRWARDRRLLPEAYLYGLAYTIKTTQLRAAYLNGKTYVEGRPLYFPEAFAIKTPIAVMVLALAGLAAILLGRARPSESILAAGLAAFALVYGVFTIGSGINIGHRHLVPIYPVLFVCAGAAATWGGPAGRILIGAMVAWLGIAVAWIHPHYLAYFNESIGGPSRGHLYLADSNIDWGQDLIRLGSHVKRTGERIKLAYFGTGDPAGYGIDAEWLLSATSFGRPARLAEGTYVVSVTQILGVNWPVARVSFWESEENRGEYRRLELLAASPDPGPANLRARAAALEKLDRMRQGLLISRLSLREPDERIGYSLFVYRLTREEAESLIAP